MCFPWSWPNEYHHHTDVKTSKRTIRERCAEIAASRSVAGSGPARPVGPADPGTGARRSVLDRGLQRRGRGAITAACGTGGGGRGAVGAGRGTADHRLWQPDLCRWEHVISENVERRILELTGHPTTSPFGNP